MTYKSKISELSNNSVLDFSFKNAKNITIIINKIEIRYLIIIIKEKMIYFYLKLNLYYNRENGAIVTNENIFPR